VLYFAAWKQHYSLYPQASVWSRRSRTNSHPTRSEHNPFFTLRPSPREVDRTHSEVPRQGSRRAERVKTRPL